MWRMHILNFLPTTFWHVLAIMKYCCRVQMYQSCIILYSSYRLQLPPAHITFTMCSYNWPNTMLKFLFLSFALCRNLFLTFQELQYPYKGCSVLKKCKEVFYKSICYILKTIHKQLHKSYNQSCIINYYSSC